MKNMSSELREFMLDRCLEVDTEKRADTKELLGHSFLLNTKSLDILKPNIQSVLNKCG